MLIRINLNLMIYFQIMQGNDTVYDKITTGLLCRK